MSDYDIGTKYDPRVMGAYAFRNRLWAMAELIGESKRIKDQRLSNTLVALGYALSDCMDVNHNPVSTDDNAIDALISKCFLENDK